MLRGSFLPTMGVVAVWRGRGGLVIPDGTTYGPRILSASRAHPFEDASQFIEGRTSHETVAS